MVGILDGSTLFSQLALLHPYPLLQSHHLRFKALLLPMKSHRPLPLYGCCCHGTLHPILPTAPSAQTTLGCLVWWHMVSITLREQQYPVLEQTWAPQLPAQPATGMLSLPLPITQHGSDLLDGTRLSSR